MRHSSAPMMVDDSKPRRRPLARKRPRAPVRAEVTLGSDDNFFRGFSGNISEGGIFITTHDTRPIGSVVDVELDLPDEHKERISVRGEVRWVREYDGFRRQVDPGMGLRFVDLSSEDRARIESFVQRREPLFFDD